MKRSSIIAAIACGALAAGCGGAPSSSTSSRAAVTSESSTSSAALTTPSATTTQTTTTTRTRTPAVHRHHRHPPATSGPTGLTALPSSGTPTPSPPDHALQVAACKRMVASDTSISLTVAEARVLDQLCETSGSRDPSKVAAAKLEICLLVVKDSGLPSAAAKAERESCRLDQGS